MLGRFLLVLYFLCSVSRGGGGPGFSYADTGSGASGSRGGKVLNVREEMWKETMELQMGSRLYKLQGLKPFTWYEVKISYPASMPARFSIQLKQDGASELGLNWNRRLLNTEKLIFRTDGLDGDQNKWNVLVTVEPEGVVAIPNVPEREYIIFNIVCDELLLGIPHKAWWIVFLALLCLGLAFSVPRFLPSYLLLKSGSPEPQGQHFSKES